MHDRKRVQTSLQIAAFGEAPEKRMSLTPHDLNLRNHFRSLRTEIAGEQANLRKLETERDALNREWLEITNERRNRATGDRLEFIKAEQSRLKQRAGMAETLIYRANERLKALKNDWEISGCDSL